LPVAGAGGRVPVPDAGCRVPGAGAGCRMPGAAVAAVAGCRARCWVPDAGGGGRCRWPPVPVGGRCRLVPVAGASCWCRLPLPVAGLYSSIKLTHRKATAKIQNTREIKAKPSG